MKYQSVTLKEIAQIAAGGTPARNKKEYWDKGNIPWVKISDIKGKYLNSVGEYITEEGLNNSSTKFFKKNTIIYTIFATIGEVSVLKMDACTNQAIAGIKVNEEIADIMYIYYYLKSIREKVLDIGRGVAQNNINLSILKEMRIPLPSLDEQKKIVAVLEKAQALIEKRKEAIAKLDELIQSMFLDMFGDPVNNSLNWDKFKLGEVGTLARGKSKHRPRNAPELLNGKYPLIQTGDVARADLYIREYKQTYSELGLHQSKMWEKGTLCITIAANIAKTGILTFDSCFPDSVVGFIPNEKSNINYIQIWFSFLQKIIEDAAPESAQKNINLKILGDLDVVLPPIDLQNKFSIMINKIDQEKQKMKQSLSQLEVNFQTLLQQAFKGELKFNTEITA